MDMVPNRLLSGTISVRIVGVRTKYTKIWHNSLGYTRLGLQFMQRQSVSHAIHSATLGLTYNSSRRTWADLQWTQASATPGSARIAIYWATLLQITRLESDWHAILYVSFAIHPAGNIRLIESEWKVIRNKYRVIEQRANSKRSRCECTI